MCAGGDVLLSDLFHAKVIKYNYHKKQRRCRFVCTMGAKKKDKNLLHQ